MELDEKDPSENTNTLMATSFVFGHNQQVQRCGVHRPARTGTTAAAISSHISASDSDSSGVHVVRQKDSQEAHPLSLCGFICRICAVSYCLDLGRDIEPNLLIVEDRGMGCKGNDVDRFSECGSFDTTDDDGSPSAMLVEVRPPI